MASHDKDGINTTSLAKNLSEINGLTDTNNQAITENTEIFLPKILRFNDYQYTIKKDGTVVKFGTEYIKEGLLLHLDGKNNTRNGHSTTTTTWEDLSGNNNDFTKLDSASNAIWSDNSYIGDDTNRTLLLNKAILKDQNECTVEVCYDIPKFKSYYWIFQNRKGNGNPTGFQFCADSSNKSITLFVNKTIYNSTSINVLGKRTMAFALDNVNITYSDNGQIYTESPREGLINSVMISDLYTIGSAHPWGPNFLFEGNIYSIRIYNRKLSENELKNNYEFDRVRFNMD